MEPLIRAITGIIAGICMGKSLLKMFSVPSKRWKRVLLYLLLGVAISLPSWVGDENPILLFPVFMLGFWLLLPGEKLPKFIMGGIFYTLLIPVNMLVDSTYLGSTMQMVAVGCKALCWCASAWFLLRIVPEGGLRLSKKLWMLVGGLTLAPLVSMLSFSIWGNTFQTEEQYLFYSYILRRFGYTILPFVLISSLMLLIVVVVLSRHETLEQESKLAALRDVYYASVKQEQTGLRTLRHDLRNHVTAIQGLLEQDKRAEADRYLQELTDSPALRGGGRYSENDTANVVLCSKAAQMAELGLIPDFTIQIPKAISIPAPDLCALLCNALDNAIAGTVGASNKTVTLKVRLEKGLFMLQVQNDLGGVIHADFSTTKQDTARHGLGLAGMREIARRNGGSLDAAVKDGRFELLICFPCREM